LLVEVEIENEPRFDEKLAEDVNFLPTVPPTYRIPIGAAIIKVAGGSNSEPAAEVKCY
jgi:hypothetical protein